MEVKAGGTEIIRGRSAQVTQKALIMDPSWTRVITISQVYFPAQGTAREKGEKES
jgi:hypothetical protein